MLSVPQHRYTHRTETLVWFRMRKRTTDCTESVGSSHTHNSHTHLQRQKPVNKEQPNASRWDWWIDFEEVGYEELARCYRERNENEDLEGMEWRQVEFVVISYTHTHKHNHTRAYHHYYMKMKNQSYPLVLPYFQKIYTPFLSSCCTPQKKKKKTFAAPLLWLKSDYTQMRVDTPKWGLAKKHIATHTEESYTETREKKQM